MAALGAWGTSIACQRRRKAILAVRSGDGNLPRQDCHPAGDVPFWGATARYVESWYRFWASQGRLSLYGSGRGRVSIARLAKPPSGTPPRRSDRHTAGPNREHLGGTRGPRRPKRLVVVTQAPRVIEVRGRPAAGSRRRTPTKLQIYEYVRPTGVPVQSPSRSIRAAKIAPPPRTRTRMLTLARMFARFCFHVSLFCPTCATGLLLCSK